MSPASAAEPIRTGVFERTPFVQLLLELNQTGFSGTLVAQFAGRELKVLLRTGRPVAAGPVERGASLEQGLMPLCALTAGGFRLYADDLVGQAAGFTWGGFDTLGFLRSALKEKIPQGAVDAVLSASAAQPLQLSPDTDVRALGLHGREAQLAERLRGGGETVASLTADSGLPEPWARRVLYFLLVTGHAVAQSQRPVQGTGTSHMRMRAVSAPLSGAPQAHNSSMRPATAGSTSNRPGTAPSAWQQLAARRASSAPPLVPRERSASTPSVPAVESPEQEVERLLRARDVEAALKVARRVVAERPETAAAQALLGWVLLQVDPTGPVSPELVDAVNRALRLDPEHPRGLYTKALAYRRMGRELEALRYFQRTARADPQHIDARRELRLAQMRGTIGKPAKKR